MKTKTIITIMILLVLTMSFIAIVHSQAQQDTPQTYIKIPEGKKIKSIYFKVSGEGEEKAEAVVIPTPTSIPAEPVQEPAQKLTEPTYTSCDICFLHDAVECNVQFSKSEDPYSDLCVLCLQEQGTEKICMACNAVCDDNCKTYTNIYIEDEPDEMLREVKCDKLKALYCDKRT